MIEPSETDWIQQARQRGWLPTIRALLDVIEPLGPLASQVLWVAQPAAGLFGMRDVVGDIAQALEAPDGVDRLRHQLDDETTR